MSIERFELFPLRLRFKRPFVTAAATVTERHVAVLRLTGADGAIGLGEVTPYPHQRSGGLADLVSVLELEARPRLEGCAIDAAAPVLEELESRLPAPALAAVDLALMDLRARRRNLPLADWLDRPARRRVEVNATIATDAADEAAELAARFVADGFRTLKLKVGTPNDRQRVSAVRNAAGPNTRLRLDANGAWLPDEAIEKINALAEFGLELIEQPVKANDLAGMRRVRESVPVPVVADEGVRDASDLRQHVRNGACDGVAVKLSQVGGISRANALVDQAGRAGLFCIVTSTLDGGVGLAAGLHFAAARPEIELACGLATQSLFENDYAVGVPPVIDGAMTIGPAPGLGVELDDRLLAELSLDLG
jgi:o-succinylbenzoate synthase